MKVLRLLLALVVVAGAAAVLAGVGQGGPPGTFTFSAAAKKASLERVAKGSKAVRTGKALFTSEGCSSCHTVAAADAHGTLGPRLDVVLMGLPRAATEGFIEDPKTVMIPGYDNDLMPRDYKKRLTGGEIRALTSFLTAAAKR